MKLSIPLDNIRISKEFRNLYSFSAKQKYRFVKAR